MIFTIAACLAWMAQAPPPIPLQHPVIPQLYHVPTYGPTYAEVTFGERVLARSNGAEGQLTMPIPSEYTGQHLFSLKVQCDPPGALQSWKLESLPDEPNAVIRMSVAPSVSGAFVSWTIRMVTPGETEARNQKKDFEAWKISGPFDPVIQAAIARAIADLREDKIEREELPGEAAMWTARYRGGWSGAKIQRDIPPAADSLNRALLCVAILQKMGVPSRVVSYLPILLGPEARALWLVEYQSEDGAWEMVDPTIGLTEPTRSSVLVLEIPPPAEEKRLLARLPLSQGPTAAEPIEISPNLSFDKASGDREVLIRQLEVYPWQAGARLLLAARVRGEKVLESARQGKNDWIDDAAFQAAMAKGPTGLALFLNGQPTFPSRPKG